MDKYEIEWDVHKAGEYKSLFVNYTNSNQVRE